MGKFPAGKVCFDNLNFQMASTWSKLYEILVDSKRVYLQFGYIWCNVFPAKAFRSMDNWETRSILQSGKN